MNIYRRIDRLLNTYPGMKYMILGITSGYPLLDEECGGFYIKITSKLEYATSDIFADSSAVYIMPLEIYPIGTTDFKQLAKEMELTALLVK